MRRDPVPADAFERYAALACAYRQRGGLAGSDDVLRLLRPHAEQPISRLARWIVAREAISFSWRSCTLLPLFQFERRDMSLRPAPSAVTRELRAAFDDWDLASWFVHPNSWLHGAAPIDRVGAEPAAVLDAARADRFIAIG